MVKELRKLLNTLGFLSRVPIPKSWCLGEFNLTLYYFPLVGLLMGFFLLGVKMLLNYSSPSLVPFGLTLAWLLYTGGLHLDGLMDTADGLLSGRDISGKLAVMKDSRVGTFGVAAAIMLILGKYNFLSLVSKQDLLIMPLTARLAMGMNLFLFPMAKEQGLGNLTKIHVDSRSFYISVFIGVLLILFISAPKLVPLAFVLVFAFVFGRWVNKQVGGQTGDTIGAVGELSELWYLIAVVMLD